jgi:hypothetical protein
MSLRGAAVAVGLAVAASAAHSQLVVIDEGFDNVDALPASGWVFLNASTPTGPTGWFQGDPLQFDAFAGPANSYIAANFNNGMAGGAIANYLFTPAFTAANGGTVSFWARTFGDEGFTDVLRFGLTHGGTTPADFVEFGSPVTLTPTWTRYSFTFGSAFGVTGRAAVEYVGAGLDAPASADLADFAGVDSLTVNVVPEPETWALLGLGFGVLGVVWRRRRSAA